MPSFDLYGYKFFFWSNEFMGNGQLEPIHIHVSAGNVGRNAPKWWVGHGKVSKADVNNINLKNYGIKQADIPKIESIICANSQYIFELWYEFFGEFGIEHESVK